ncbi:MAG: response regulator [Chitinophagaceae bacterium]
MIKRIICVDDDALCLMIEEMVIKQTNIVKEIHLADNATDALSLLKTFQLLDNNQPLQESPTLLFLDLNMPGMDGFEFLDALEARNGNLSEKLKIVILSSSIDHNDISRSMKYKYVINFISKPLTVNALAEVRCQLSVQHH